MYGESIVLARLRTLMALERNYLAAERTNLAELRTGLGLTIIGPSSSLISFSSNWNSITTYILLGLFALITIYGLYIIIVSRKKLRVIRRNKRRIHRQEEAVLNTSQEAKNLLMDAMDPYCKFIDEQPNEVIIFE